MAPINANDINDAKAFVPAKKALPEVDTEGSNGNGISSKGYVNIFKFILQFTCFKCQINSDKPVWTIRINLSKLK